MNKIVPTVLNMRHVPHFVQQGQYVTDNDDDVVDIPDENLMRLCVRGAEYVADVTSISCEPNTRMYKLCEKWRERIKDYEPRGRKSIFLNRNSMLFQYILDYYVTGQLHLPDGVCGSMVKVELSYWGIDQAMVTPCCLWKLREGVDAMTKISEILGQYQIWDTMAKKATTWREKVWISYLLPFNSTLGKVMFWSQMGLYVLFLLSLNLQTMSEFRESRDSNATDNNTTLPLKESLESSDVVLWVKIVDLVLLLLITLCLAFIVAVCPDRKQYFGDPVSIIGALTLLYQWFPVTLMLTFDQPPEWYLSSIAIINGGKVARVFPIILLLAPFRSMKMLAKALLLSKKELGLLVVLIMISVLIFGYLVFVIETSHTETHFRSIPDGLWWGIMTLTTVGYGDLYPQTFWGRLIGIACAIVGIIVIALPVPIIAGNFTKMYDLFDVIDYYRSMTVKTPDKKAAEPMTSEEDANDKQATTTRECTNNGDIRKTKHASISEFNCNLDI